MAVMETISESELEKVLRFGSIIHYECDAEYDYLIDYYILTGELPDDCKVTENNDSLINDDKIN